MANFLDETGTRAGTVGGTLLSILPAIGSGEIIRTAVLAAVGAMVSFMVSVLLKIVVQHIKKKRPFRR